MRKHNFSEYFDYYISKVKDEVVWDALHNSGQEVLELVTNLDDDQWKYAYDDGKWSMGQLFYHLLDTERIMCYRALCFARGQQIELPGYDHTVFAESVDETLATKDLFTKEYNYLRQGTILMFNGFNSEQLKRQAHFNGLHIEVGQMARLITGHEQHHLEIIRSRYL